MKKTTFFIVISFLFLAIGSSQANIQDGLIAFYPFSGNANDASGNGYHGTVDGPILNIDRFDNMNSSYHFDGYADVINLPNNVLDNRLDITTSIWVKTSRAEGAFINGANNSKENEYFIHHHQRTNRDHTGLTVFTKQSALYTEVRINDNIWHHVAVTRNGSSGLVEIFLDGILIDYKVLTKGSLSIDPGGLMLGREQDCLGGCFSGGAQDFSGQMDDIRIYNRILSGQEIISLYLESEFGIDSDGDGYTEANGDCDDTDAAINPGMVEICGDGIDQDCNGSDLLCSDPLDVDDDGDGFTENQGDCDDTDSTIAPNAIEICGDGIDQDCNGSDLACVSGPSPPTGVAASDDTFLNKVQVTWNPAAGIIAYDIFRADMPAWTGTAPRRIATSVSGNSYDDTTAVANNRYYYWVKSRDGLSISKYSMFDAGYWGSMGAIPAVPTNVSASDGTVSGKVNITWDATSNTLIYEVWRADIPAFLGGKLKKIGTSDTTSYNDTTATIGNRYYYWIKARNSWGVSRYSTFDTGYIGGAYTPLPAPTDVSASDGTVSGKVNITWNTVSGSVVYEVWRATDLVSNGGKPIRVGFLPGTSFEDTSASRGTSYYYWVKSRDSWGSSKYSVPDTGYRN